MRKITLIIYLLGAFLICGCTLHLSSAVKSSVSEKGAHSTRAIKTPIGIYFTSISFVPGAEGLGRVPKKRQESLICVNRTDSAQVFYTTPEARRAAQDNCKAILDAIAYVSEFGKITQRIQYQASLVPYGTEVEEKKIDIYPFSKIKPRFVFFEGDDAKSAIVGVFAHEYVHMFLDLADEHHDVTSHEERIAYMAEVCAQLNVLGSISLKDLPGAPITDEKANPVERSSSAGYAIRKYVGQFLSNGVVDSKSQSGLRLARECDSQLRSFLEVPRNPSDQ